MNGVSIDLSEDLQNYSESVVLGLTAKQLIFSILAVGGGAAIILLTYKIVGLTVSCYIATPFVVPIAMSGFYNYHGLTFLAFAKKMIFFSFFNRPLIYASTENTEFLQALYLEMKQDEQQQEQQHGNGKEDMEKVKRKAIMVLVTTVAVAAGIFAMAAYVKTRR